MNTETPTNWQGQMLGRYRLSCLLGRGGMGEVWLADDTQLRRQVAVKMLPAVLASDRTYLEDFAHEARAAAALEHPHILQVHDFGEQRNAQGEVITYLITPYISGGSLRDRLQARKGPLSVTESLRYLRQAALAIDYAHSQHVLHRDIKPANMLLQEDWLFLADFGIAKLLDAETQRGRTHAGAGTPEYMAPEQVQHQAQSASDRYSLAIVAYQLFTGQVPFKSDSPYGTLLMQLQNRPPEPRKLNGRIPVMVEDALMQGLAKKPEQRYPTCIAFIDALERGWSIGSLSTSASDTDATVLAPWHSRFNQPEPEQDLPPQLPFPSQVPPHTSMPLTPALEQPTPSATLMALQHNASAYGPYGPPAMQRQTQPMTANNAAYPVAYAPPTNIPGYMQAVPPLPPQAQTQQQKVGRRQVVIGGMAAAVVLVAGGATLASVLYHPPVPQTATKPIPGPHKLITGIPLLNLVGHSDSVWKAAWHPSGRYLATAGDDTRVMLWDVGSALQKGGKGFQTVSTPLRQWKFSNNIEDNGICWSPDGNYIAVSVLTEQNTLHLIEAFKNTAPITFTNASQANSVDIPSYGYVSWSPTGSAFAASIFSKEVVALWQPGHSTAPIKLLSTGASPTQAAGVDFQETAWSADGSMLAGSSADFKVIVWQVSTGSVKYTIPLPDRFPKLQSVLTLRSAIGWSPMDLNRLYVSDVDAAIVLDVRHNSPLLVLGTNDPDALTPPPPSQNTSGINWVPNVTGLTWSPNGRYLAGGYGRSRKIYIWDIQQLEPKAKPNQTQVQTLLFPTSNTAPGHSSTIIDVAWSPNGRYLATTSFDKTVIVWQVDGA